MTGLFARVISRSVTPGPGSYNPTMFGKPSSPRFTLKSRQERRVEVLDVPYRKIPSSIGDVPRISLGSRHPTKPLESTPGPEYIPPTIGHDAKKSSFGKRVDRSRDPRADIPGPGTYDIGTTISKDSLKFSLYGRPNDYFVSKSDTPGPEYIPPIIGHDAKKSSFGKRVDRSPDNRADIPGPGTYDIGTTISKDSLKFSLYGRPNDYFVSKSDTPGPEYIPPTIGHDAKKSSLSSRQAGARDTRIDYPGPDRYNVRTPFAKGARSASLHSRPNDMFAVRSSGPGPAAYYPDYSLTRPSSPSPTMHIRTKVAEPQETAGYLDIGSTLGGPKFTIGRRENLDLVEI